MAPMKYKLKTKGDEMTNVFSSLRSDYDKENLKRSRSARKRKTRSGGSTKK